MEKLFNINKFPVTSGVSPCFQMNFRHAWGQNPPKTIHIPLLVLARIFSASQKNIAVTPDDILSFIIDSEEESSFSLSTHLLTSTFADLCNHKNKIAGGFLF